MINLLTQKHTRSVATEYKQRRRTVFFVTLVVVSLMGIIFLIPSFILSQVKLNEVSIEVQTARDQEELSRSGGATGIVLKETNDKIKRIETVRSNSSKVDIIAKTIAHSSEGVRLRSFSVIGKGSEKDAVGKLVVTGVARDRNSLTAFLSALRNDALFTDVVSPVSNLTKDKDIQFSIDISGEF